MPRTSALRAYRHRVRKSSCKGLRKRTCRKTPGCKIARGTKRRFCRKSGNKRRKSSSSKTKKSKFFFKF